MAINVSMQRPADVSFASQFLALAPSKYSASRSVAVYVQKFTTATSLNNSIRRRVSVSAHPSRYAPLLTYGTITVAVVDALKSCIANSLMLGMPKPASVHAQRGYSALNHMSGTTLVADVLAQKG